MKHIFFLFLFSFILLNPVYNQAEADSLQVDSLTIVEDTLAENTKGFFVYSELNQPIPKKSLTYSLIFPGMGQAYNRRWWKLPLVYGGVGGMIYLVDYNQDLYRRFRDALILELEDQEHEFTPFGFNSTSLRSFRDTYDRYTQLSYMGLIAVYGVIAIEAFVDGHLLSFDISDDLSMSLDPAFPRDPISGYATPGFSVKIYINSQ